MNKKVTGAALLATVLAKCAGWIFSAASFVVALYLVCQCFGWDFTIKAALGCWLVLEVITQRFERLAPNNK